jgi:chorismate lyase
MTKCLLSNEEIRQLDRDLRILIATNGTLTRILNVVADEEIVVKIIKQQIHHDAPQIEELRRIRGRILQRDIFLTGRKSGIPFVAAESWIAIDLLPPATAASLTTTDRPLGEVIADYGLETFKEAAQVWVGELPGWAALTRPKNSRSKSVARRYRIFTGGRPVLIVTEYFLRNVFRDARCEGLDYHQQATV